MRLDFQQPELAARERLRRPVREAAGKRGLARARRADQHDDAVQRDDAAVDLAAHREIQNRLRQQPALDVLVEDDRVPERAERWVRQRADPLDAFGQVGKVADRHVVHRGSLSAACSATVEKAAPHGAAVVSPWADSGPGRGCRSGRSGRRDCGCAARFPGCG